jgi:type I restriction enzyme S subunit
MEVRKGYKQTEVGVIPEDWDIKTLGSFIALQRGHDLTERNRRKGDVPVMGSAGQNGFHDTAIVKGPGVVLGRSGASFGQAHYCKEDFWAHNTALYVTDFLGNLPLFVYYFLKGIDFSRHNSGGAQQSLNRNFIAPILIAVPKYTEQEAIAEALSDADALIESLEALLAKKRQVKQGAMSELLSGKRRVVESGKWEVKTIEELTICLDNLRVPLNESQRAKMQGDYPYCGANGVLDYVNSFVVDDDVILMAEDGGYFDEYATRPIAYKMSGKIWVNNHAHILKAKEEYNQDFIFYSLVHKNILSFLASGTRAKLNKFEMYKIEINIPPTKAEQTAIAEILSDMDAEIRALEGKLSKARAVKAGMMSELLGGRVRLV